MGSLLKKMLIVAIGAAASYYATKTVNAALTRKPLKTRVREGKEKVADIKSAAMDKATSLKAAAQVKANSLIEEKSDQETKD